MSPERVRVLLIGLTKNFVGDVGHDLWVRIRRVRLIVTGIVTGQDHRSRNIVIVPNRWNRIEAIYGVVDDQWHSGFRRKE